MEKTKLVRTFGTALATATLSFGLFAPAALAVDANVTGKAEIKGEAKDSDAAKAGETVVVSIPVSVTDADKINDGTMTIKATDGTIVQELKLGLVKNGASLAFEDNDAGKASITAGKFGFLGKTDDNGQFRITKIYAKVLVDANMLNGKWNLDEIKLLDTKGDDIATIDNVDATFEVYGNEDHVDIFSIDLETIMTKKSVYRDKNNKLYVSFKSGGWNVDAVEVVYLNPAGEEQKYSNEAGADNPATIDNANYRIAVERLHTEVDGSYKLQSITLKNKLSDTLTDCVTFDDYAILADGDYEVSLTGVEAMIRLYNPWTGEHIYTNDPLEGLAAVAAGWIDEGLAWYAPVNQLYDNAVAPVYRVYNQYNGEHHYTTSSTEAATLVAAGWTDEGVGFYTTTKNDRNAEPVFRLFNPFATVGTHHYTTSQDEYDALVKAGWKGENVGWYGVKVNDFKRSY